MTFDDAMTKRAVRAFINPRNRLPGERLNMPSANLSYRDGNTVVLKNNYRELARYIVFTKTGKEFIRKKI